MAIRSDQNHRPDAAGQPGSLDVTDFTIFLIDDDPRMLEALVILLQTEGYRPKPYSSSEKFLNDHDPAIPGCVVLDLSMRGLELQQTLAHHEIERPVIFLYSSGRVAESVLAMKAGAIDVLLMNPINPSELLQAIKRAMERDNANAESRAVRELLQKLSPREKEVLNHLVAGRINRETAAILGVGLKTIKMHRGRVMKKLGVRNVAQLVRLTEMIPLQPSYSI
jgi:FixJ family two-component response regulator